MNKLLSSIYDELKKHGVVVNKTDFAGKLGYNRSYISELFSEHTIPDKLRAALLEKFRVNPTFIDSGELPILRELPAAEAVDVEMLDNEDDGHKKGIINFRKRVPHKLRAPQGWNGVPMYNEEFTATFVELIRDNSYYEPLYYFDDPRFMDCNFGARITGDSMHPIIRRGDYVICREIMDKSFILAGEIYLIVTRNGFETCKYIHPGATADEIFLKPYNDSIPGQNIHISQVAKLYLVKGAIREF